jgi:hypothetical protein
MWRKEKPCPRLEWNPDSSAITVLTELSLLWIDYMHSMDSGYVSVQINTIRKSAEKTHNTLNLKKKREIRYNCSALNITIPYMLNKLLLIVGFSNS